MTDRVPGPGHPPPSDDIGAASDDDGPVKKRLRVSRACDPCRRRKERCDGSQPTCQRCNKVGRPCSYIPYRKRGLRTGYVRGVEIILGLLIHSSPGTEDLISAVLRHKGNNQATSSFSPTSAPPASSLLESWRKSKAHQDLQKALLSSDEDEDEELYLQNLDDKLTSAFNVLPRQPRNRELQLQDPPAPADVISHLPHTISPALSLPPQNLTQQTPHHDLLPDALNLSQLTLPPNWSQLIEVYLTNTHCWLPIIQKYTLYRSASLLSSSGGSAQGPKPSSGEVCSLWAVLAYGSHQLRAIDPSASASGASLQILAKQLAVQTQPKYEVGHVHALLTLTLLEVSQQSWVNAWLWVGRAVYTASTLGIVPIRQGMPSQEPVDDGRRRLALGCFVLDTLVAAKLGLRPYLRQSDLSDVGSLSSDGIEEWELWRPITQTNTQSALFSPGPSRVLSTFNHLCYIVGVLNQVANPTASDGRSVNLQQYMDQLGKWNDRNPLHDCLSVFKEPPRLASEVPHTMQLRLAALATYSILLNQRNHQQGIVPEERPISTLMQGSLAETQRILSDPGITATVLTATQFFPAARIFLEMLQENTAFSTDSLMSSSWDPSILQAEKPPQPNRITSETMTDPISLDERVLIPTLAVPASHLFGASGQEAFAPRSIPSQPSGLDQISKPVQHMQTVGISTSAISRTSPNSSTEPNNFMNLTPPLSTQSIDHAQVADMSIDSEQAMSNTSLSETSDQNGLFNQLSLLDREDWPVFSEDFMEHLGLSRDGSFLDYQSLFAPS